jgi:hypothetical protein
MAFKTKTKNRQILDDRQTLDAKHNNILQSFTENKHSVVDLQNELNNINSIIVELNTENAKSPILNLLLQQKIWEYDDRKKMLEETINRIENNIDETEYMLKTGKLLSNYYKIIKDEKQMASNNAVLELGIENTEKYNEKFNENNNNTSNTTTSNTTTSNTTNSNTTNNKNTKSNKKLSKDLNLNLDNTNESIHNKDTIYEKFMLLIDKNYININNDNIDVFDMCNKCAIEMLLNNNTGQLICPKCGMMENIIVDSDKPSFKEPPKEMTSFCYKRINHLNEFLAQFQAKETTDIPEDVYNEILMEIKKERITNMAVITPDKMRILLKKIKKNDYYEHIPYIINQLNGLPAPVIAPEIEEIIRGMFKAIQIPFEKYCPQKRKNFLSYNYVMYKFFELLELDEYLDCFQLLKSRTKLHQQDEIWKNICKDLNWEFIKSL